MDAVAEAVQTLTRCALNSEESWNAHLTRMQYLLAKRVGTSGFETIVSGMVQLAHSLRSVNYRAAEELLEAVTAVVEASQAQHYSDLEH
jgi:hypothetical protein